MRKFIPIIIASILISSFVQAAITITPSVWQVDYVKGATAPTQAFTFENSDNTTVDLALSISGDNSAIVSLPSSSLSVPGNSTASVTLTLTVGGSVTPDTYVNRLNYGSSNVPLVIKVIDNQTTSSSGCRLDVTPSFFSAQIVQGAQPFSKAFTVFVSKQCTDAVNIKEPLLNDVQQTANGQRPITLTGGADLGNKEPLSEGTFTIEFNTQGLSHGTYRPLVTVHGIYKGEKISTNVPVSVTVQSGATPLTGDLPDPVYTISETDLVINSTYKVTGTNVNDNYQPFVHPNDFLVGKPVNFGTDWIWEFRPVKEGKTLLKISTYYKGAPFGETFNRELRITRGNIALPGTTLRVEFYNSIGIVSDITQIQPGTTLNILVKDNETGSVIENARLYLNGAELVNKSFTTEAGREYILATVADSYPSIDTTIAVANEPVSVSVTPSLTVIKGTEMVISTTPEDSVILVDGTRMEKKFTLEEAKAYNLTVASPGYKDYSATITVKIPLELRDAAPSKAKRGYETQILFNRDTDWSVIYLDDAENPTMQNITANGASNVVAFTPYHGGLYRVAAEGNIIAEYTVKGGLTAWMKYTFIVLGSLGVLWFALTREWRGVTSKKENLTIDLDGAGK